MKRNKSLIGFLMVCLVVMSSFFIKFDSLAMTSYNVPIGQPSISSNSGYIEFLWRQNSTGHNVAYVYFWNCTASNAGINSSVEISVNSSSLVSFYPYGASNISLLYSSSDGVNSPVVVYSGDVSDVITSNFAGYTLLAYHVYGNYSSLDIKVEGYYNGNDFAIQYGNDVTYQSVLDIYNQIVALNVELGGKLSDIEALLRDYIYQHIYSMDYNLNDVLKILQQYSPSIDSKLQTIIDNTNKLINQSGADKSTTDKFASDSKSQAESINGLNQQSQSEKVDIDSASSSVDSYIDSNAISSYSGVLASFTGNPHILQFILIVLSVGLVSYVLFGKR